MQLKKSYIVFFSLGVFMFVARPFIGFSLASSKNLIQSHSILVKSFTKRKPEDLNDAKKWSAAISQQLTNPPQHIFLTIAALLCLFSPLPFRRDIFTKYGFLNDGHASFNLSGPLYLLTGKLTI